MLCNHLVSLTICADSAFETMYVQPFQIMYHYMVNRIMKEYARVIGYTKETVVMSEFDFKYISANLTRKF